ncbi:glycosyltransferase family 87 protein [Hoyosella sp. YIM 151337]|uniref:glycosyltransferase family 87 protein n=1 Tax=Hoyosella sp. YIM 151337 TaxID=2992742 RepID=UPI0022368642|nr:glycosyltransferase family 87 protein [Hoyosella sp. YIM 151337]MCW4354831.1 glycosyltransferase family 87 protein [Hoyosella sp. YIM 151337]
MTEAERELPSRSDPTVRQLSSVIGGPVGKHAVIGRARFFTPLRVILLLALVAVALGWLGKAACIQQYPGGADGAPIIDWRDGRQYVAMCYSDTVPLYGVHRLNELAFPYRTTIETEAADGSVSTRYMEYPVLTGLYQYAAAALGSVWSEGARHGLLPGALPVVVYFNVVALGLALFWLVTVWATAMLAGRRVWDAALVAISPLVVVHLFTNFDAIATGFAAAGLLAWSRKKPMLAGLLIGLGTAAKLYPLFILGALLVLAVRSATIRSWVQATATTVATWLLVNVPIALVNWDGWYEFFRLNSERHMDPDSIYNVIRSFTGWQGFDGPLAAGESPSILNVVTLGLFALVCVGVGYLALTAPRRPRVAQLCFLLVAGFLLTNKVWSPQYSLWLVPLAVLALPHVRILLTWMVIDALVWAPRMMYYHGIANKGLPEQWFTATVAVRDIAVVVLCVLIIRQIYRPGEDLVRQHGVDDPVGGPLAGQPDRVPSWLPPFLRPRGAQRGSEGQLSAAGQPAG